MPPASRIKVTITGGHHERWVVILCLPSFVSGVFVRTADIDGAALLSKHLPECDSLCLWLARAPVQNNHPRPLQFSAYQGDNVLVAHENELLDTVFKMLTTEGITGCPVVDADGVYVDQVDVLDIVFFVCDLFKSRQHEKIA
jgi:hypothetical protein